MFKNFSRSLLLSATLLLGDVTPGQAMLFLGERVGERASGRHNENPAWPFIPMRPDDNIKPKEGPNKEPKELLWSPASTRIVNQ